MAASPLSPDVVANDRYVTGSNQEVGITATASGGQANAYLLQAQQSRVDTVASPNDSVALPKVIAVGDSACYPGNIGMIMFVRNNTGNSMQVFGVTPDTINAVATGTGVAVPANKSAIFWCDSYTQSTNVGTWQMNLSA
jgi:hypothetical protein